MANTLNLGSGNWGAKESLLLGYYENGKKFFPETFDVTRATGGTRVNKDGLIETPAEIGSEEITNGDFATDTDWTYGTDWTISNGVASASGSAFSSLSPTTLISVSAGVTYKITFDLNYTSGALRTKIGGTQTGYLGYNVGNNFVEIFLTAVNTTNFSLISANLNGSIDNVSVKEYNDKNLARIDYLDDAKGALLTEPQSTNLVTYSQDFSDSSWDKDSGIIVSSSNNVSPSGLKDATEISVSNNGRIYINLSSANYTGSIFIKKGTFAYFKFSGVNIDLIAKTTSNANANLTEMSNGWFRIAYNIGSSSRPIQVQAYPDNTYSAHSDSGNYYIWGAQAEILPYATSIIPTSGSTVTRNADQVNGAGDATTFNDSEGVLMIEFALQKGDDEIRQFSLSNGSDVENVKILQLSGSTIRFEVKMSSGINFIEDVLIDAETNNKYLIQYKANDYKVFVNGVKQSVVQRSTTPIGLDRISFDRGDGASDFYGKTKQVQYFNTALTDAELIKLTTI